MRFSVIIPLFNKAPYVKKGLESVFDQSFRDFEIVVVDDGSTDDSARIAQEALESCGCKHQLIRQANAGVGTARNVGVAASNGDFICFLDADDWWAPSFLERMDWLINEYPEAGIYGSNYFYVKNGYTRVCVQNTLTGYIDYCKVYADNLTQPLWTGAVSLSKQIFKEHEGFKSHLKLGEDFDLWIRIALKHKVAFLNEPLSYYNQESDPAWRLVGKLHDPSHNMLWNLGYLEEEEKINPSYKQLIDNLRVYSLLPYYLSSKYRKDAKQELAKVDWSRQPTRTVSLYKKPIWFLKCRNEFLKAGSRIKQTIKKFL